MKLNTAYVNKWSFTFKTKLCAFQVTKIIILYEGDSNF